MESNKLRTLDRGMTALKEIASADGGLTVAELAERLGVHRAIVYRIVATLGDHAMVHRLPSGKIVLGSGMVALGAQSGGHLRAIAQPVLAKLAMETHATAFMSVAEGTDCVAVAVAEPKEAFLNISYRVGIRHPLERGASGIAILAGRPARPDDPEAVRAARAQGYSLTEGELQPGAVGVSSPVVLPDGRYPGLECSVGVVAMGTLETDAAVEATKAAAVLLAESLGA